LPFFERGGEETLGRRTAGVGDANVDAAEFPGHSRDKLAHGCGIGDITGLGNNLNAVLFSDLLCRGLQGLRVAGTHGDAAPFRGERLRRGAADSLTGSGYQGDAILQAKNHGGRIINGVRGVAQLAGVSPPD
jgi:hypothetical protein